MEKGTSAIQKTENGPYPLVTTGAERKTADTFQFDDEVVCVPTISSTGHGKASLKRVLYQEGKFALGTLLIGLVVNDRRVVNPRFLWRYLDHFKDYLIVPLMTGAANMTVSGKRLANVQVRFPALNAQEEIVYQIQDAEDILELADDADRRTSDLLPSLFINHFGSPAQNPLHWPLRHLAEVAEVTTGNIPPRSEVSLYGNAIEWIKSDNICPPRRVLTKAEEGLSGAGLKVGRVAKAGSTLVTCIAGGIASIGNVALADRDAAFNQQINSVYPKSGVNPHFLYAMLYLLKRQVQALSPGQMKGIVTKGRLQQLPVIVPPMQEQEAFAREFEVMASIETVQERRRMGVDSLARSIKAKVLLPPDHPS